MIQPVRVRAYTPPPVMSQLPGQPPIPGPESQATGSVPSHPVPAGRIAPRIVGQDTIPALQTPDVNKAEPSSVDKK
jgi:hypothetical protein